MRVRGNEELQLSFRQTITSLTFLAILAMAVRVSVANDTWWHLRAGEWMLENGRILDSDPFSLTRLDQRWIYPGWASQLLMIAVFRWTGLPGLNLLTALSVVLAFAFLWRTSQAPPLFKAFVFVLGATVSGVYWSARPQIFSFAMTGIFYWSMRRAHQRGPRALWLPVVLMAVWANLHGGFAIGFILLAIELLASALDRYLPARLRLVEAGATALRPAHLLLAVALSLLAICINPHGPQLLTYPFRTVSIATLQNYIQEWQSPNFHLLELQPFLLMLLLTAGAMAISPKRPSWRDLLTAGTFAAMGLTAARNVALFGLLATPILVRYGNAVLADRLPERDQAKQLPPRLTRAVNLILVILVAVAAVLKAIEPLKESVNLAALERQAPVAAVRYLQDRDPPGPLFNSYNWGSYVVWALFPQYLSFVDGRTDLFDDAILDQYIAIWRADPGWESHVQRWGVRLALVEPNAPLASQLSRMGWTTLYEDQMSIILADEN